MERPIIAIKGVVTTERFEIPFRVYENKGPHIICINGVQQSMAMWQTFIARFSRDFRITLFDFPDQGKGKVLSGEPHVTLDEQVEILRNVMKAASVRPDATICAASWGGVVALVFAAKYQDGAKRLILASLGTRPNKKMLETIRSGCEIAPENREEIAETLIRSFGQDLPENIKQRIITQFRGMSKESLAAFYEHGLLVMSTKTLNEVVDLSKIKVKTILINGENDTIIDLDDVKSLALKIPDCEMKIIKNAGHFLHLEREDILDIYQEVLNS